MKRIWTIALIVGTLCVIGFLAIGLWLAFQPPELNLEGEIEATEIDVSGKLPGRVSRVFVKLGQRVEAGELLFTIASPETQAKLTQAKAAQNAAAALSRKADTGAREQEIRAAKQVWQQAEAAAELAESTFARVQRLLDEGVVPRQRRDEAQAKADAARAAAEAAKASYDLAQDGARSEDKDAAAANQEQAAGAVAEVEAYLVETEIKAPIAGEVASLLVDAGELAPTGFPVITLVDLDDVWAVFQIREDLLPGLEMGTEFTAAVPAIGDESVRFKVSYIAPLGAFATWRATSASDGFDLKTFEVRARPTEPVDGLRPGMSVVAPWTQ